MDFSHDKNVLNIADQFMFGPALLINPVTEYKTRARQVYLPAGTGWYDLRSGRHFNGGHSIKADAPYTDIPIYVKEGSIIACGPDIKYTTEKPADPIRLFIYAGRDGSFTLYRVNFQVCWRNAILRSSGSERKNLPGLISSRNRIARYPMTARSRRSK
jgi:alpha-D-xyloside xylohydrolase